MFTLERGRCVFVCDSPRCAIRMDVGREVASDFLARRLPSGWLRLEANVHYCPMHADQLRVRAGLPRFAA
jgi:hypothetical protein